MPKKLFFYIDRLLAIVAAVILLQTLFYKFTAHEDSVYIFSQIGVEPYGRIGLGVFELLTAALLLYSRTAVYGAILGIGVMLGALVTHLFIIGVVVRNDGGALFTLALVVFLCCSTIFFIRRKEAASLLKKRGAGKTL